MPDLRSNQKRTRPSPPAAKTAVVPERRGRPIRPSTRGQIDELAEVFRRFLERMARPGAEGPSLAARLAEPGRGPLVWRRKAIGYDAGERLGWRLGF